MDDILYTTLSRYFNKLSKFGYTSYNEVYNILYLILIRDFIYNDFYGYITEDDYRYIERSLYCLFGKSCLIPYPQYLVMGNLNLGSLSELAYRVERNEQNIIEITNNVNILDTKIEDNTDLIQNNSNLIENNSDRIDNNSNQINTINNSIKEIKSTKVIKGDPEFIQINDITIS